MSYFIRIFGQAAESLSRRDIQEFILGGLHFDQTPVFIPAFLDPDSLQAEWENLKISYDADRLTITLMRYMGDDVFNTERDALNALIVSLPSPDVQSNLIEMLNVSNQLMLIEIDRESLSEEAWAMLDALEAYLAGSLMGLVYAPDDGFYGSGLQLLHKVG